MRNNKLLYLFTLVFFALGFVNIHFAIFGIICMVFPFVLLVKNQKKTWCQSYCPRASLYTTIGKLKKTSRKTPRFFIKGNMKYIMLTYFGFNLFFIFMSTMGVANGRMPAMEYLRFLFVFPIPVELPQLIVFPSVAPWVTHLAYRFYSMMLTTTTLGLILALTYKPRTWCTICPIGTISDAYLENTRKQGQGSTIRNNPES